MARTLSSGNNLSRASAVRTSAPLTLAVWFKAASLHTAALLSINNGNTTNRFSIGCGSTGSVNVSTNAAQGVSAGPWAVDTWNHCCGVITASNSRAVFLNGAGKATETTSATPSGLNRTAIGVHGTSTQNPFAGEMREAAVWSVALSDDEVAQLARGIGPYAIQPANLVCYWPILGAASPEVDKVAGLDLSLAGSPPQADHGFMFYGKNRFRRRGLLAA